MKRRKSKKKSSPELDNRESAWIYMGLSKMRLKGGKGRE